MKLIIAGGVIMLGALSFTAHAAEPTVSQAKRDSVAAQTIDATTRLDLKAPDIRRIFSLEEINAILSRATDPALEYVEVEAPRIGDLPFEDNSASTAEVVFESVARWFMPSESYAANVNLPPDATSPHRPVPLLQANYHPSFPPPASQR